MPGSDNVSVEITRMAEIEITLPTRDAMSFKMELQGASDPTIDAEGGMLCLKGTVTDCTAVLNAMLRRIDMAVAELQGTED